MAVTDSVTFDAAVVASAYKRLVMNLTAGPLGITFRVLDVVVVLLGTGAPVLDSLLLLIFAVGTVVLVRHILILSSRRLGLELLVDQGDIFL